MQHDNLRAVGRRRWGLLVGLLLAGCYAPPAPTEVVLVPTTAVPSATHTATPGHTATPSATPTPTWTPSPTATPGPGDAFDVETFADNSRGWDVFDSADVLSGIENGHYRFTFFGENFFQWASAPGTYDNLELKVTATHGDGPDAYMAGLLCRLVDADNFYLFSISGDGYFRVLKYVAGQAQALYDWTSSPALNTGVNASNELHVRCIGRRLILSANGALLANVIDESHSSGQVALVAAAYTTRAPVSVDFSNLRYVLPEPATLPLLPSPTATPTPTASATP